VLVVVVDRDAETLRPRLEEMRGKIFPALASANASVSAEAAHPRLEVIDRATAQALERLREMGVIQTTTRGARVLYSATNDNAGMTPSAEPAPLSAEEKSRADEHRKQAAKRLRLAKMLLDEDLLDEARETLRTAATEIVRVHAIEKRAGVTPEKLSEVLVPPLSYLAGGELLAIARSFDDGTIGNHDAPKLRELAAALEKPT